MEQLRYLKRFNESNFDPKVLSWIKDNLDMIPINDSQYQYGFLIDMYLLYYI